MSILDQSYLENASSKQNTWRQNRTLLILLTILLVALAVRYVHLGQIPHGLYMDEAADANDAVHTASIGDYKVFYPSDAGREGLWIVLMSFSVRWFGASVFAVRFWAPLVGLLTVLALYGLASQWFGSRIGLIASWLLAISFWHVLFSRVAFRGILVPLFLVSAIYFLQVAWDKSGKIENVFAVLGGICFGLGFYSYIPFRLAPVLALALLAVELSGVDRQKRRISARIFLVWILVAAIVASPLGIHFLRQPQDFTSRMTQVSALATTHPAKLILKNSVRSVWMFVGKGDLNWRQNLRGAPELGYSMALFFVIGLAQMFRKTPDRKTGLHSFVVLFWLALMLIPAVLSSEGVPHALRSIGALPAAILIAAIGADWVLHRAEEWQLAHKRHIIASVIVVIVLTGASELYRYFVVWARSEQVQQAYQALQLQASEELRSLPPSQQVLIGVEEPTDYDWRQHASVHVNPDGSSALLALQSQIPLFIAGQRPHTYYVSSRDLVMIDLHSKFGCDEEKLPSQSTFAANVLTSVPGCKGSLTFLRLTGAN